MKENGLSPRLRGLHYSFPSLAGPGRFIPAPAGSAADLQAVGLSQAVYPRACGVCFVNGVEPVAVLGLSPRLQGLQYDHHQRDRRHRFIPAPAGSAPTVTTAVRSARVYPRACGVCTHGYNGGTICSGLSPRLRGLPFRVNDFHRDSWGVIPLPPGSCVPLRLRAHSGARGVCLPPATGIGGAIPVSAGMPVWW